MRNEPGRAPDFTTAFLWSAGVLVYIALFAIWAVFGLIVACLVSAAANRGLTFWEHRRAR